MKIHKKMQEHHEKAWENIRIQQTKNKTRHEHARQMHEKDMTKA